MISEQVSPACFTIDARESGAKKLAHLNIAELEQVILNQGMVLLRGFDPSSDEQMVAFAKKLGPLLAWDFGYVLDLKINQQPQNHIFSQGKVELHWDGAFAGATPRFNFFQCLQSSAMSGGGETTFVNTCRLLESCSSQQLQQYQDKVIRYFAEKKAHYGGAIEEPLISPHPATKRQRMRFIEPFNEDNMAVNPVETQVQGMSSPQGDAFLRELIAHLYDSDSFYAHQWTQGDYLLVDNHAMLHGRHRFQGEGLTRHLKRVHIL